MLTRVLTHQSRKKHRKNNRFFSIEGKILVNKLLEAGDVQKTGAKDNGCTFCDRNPRHFALFRVFILVREFEISKKESISENNF
jgi:hypothetical protein